MKKTLAIILTLALVICMMPANAFAAAVGNVTIDNTNYTVTFDQDTFSYNAKSQAPVPTFTSSVGGQIPTFTYTYKKSEDNSAGDTVPIEAGTYEMFAATNSAQAVKIGDFTISSTSIIATEIKTKKALDNTITSNSDDTSLKSFFKLTLGGVDVAESNYKLSANVVGNTIKVTAVPSETGSSFSNSSKEVTFNLTTSIVGASITAADNSTDFMYTGSKQDPTLKVTPKGGSTALIKGTDYTVSCTDQTAVGDMVTVTVIGKNLYDGQVQQQFQIQPFNLNKATVTPNSITVTVGETTLNVTVQAGNNTLVQGRDFTVAGFDTTSAANGKTAKITGKGNYTGTASVKYNVVDSNSKNLSASKLSMSNLTYNGYAQSPTPTLTIGSTTVNPSYYTVKYREHRTSNDNLAYSTTKPTNAGVYDVRVESNTNNYGQYTGSKEFEQAFRINQLTINSSAISATYNGTVVKPVILRFNGKELSRYIDYDVDSYSSSKYYYTVTGKGNFTGTRLVYTETRDLSSCTAAFDDNRSTKAYGPTYYPGVTVYYGSTRLTKESDYTVTYKNANNQTVSYCKDPGTYSVIITGIGSYKGTKILYFTITGTDIGNYTVTLKESSVTADGRTKTPVITSVSYGYYSKLSSSDYTVSYQDSTGKEVKSYQMIAPGTYKVVVTGKNGYTGSCYATFTIVGLSQSITGVDGSYKVYPTSETFRLYPKATEGRFTYTSSDPSVASVDAFGNVTPYKAGRAKITISTTGNVRYNPVTTSTVIKVYPNKAAMTRKPWTAGKGKIKARWNKQDNVTRYEVRYSKNKSFKKGTYKTKKVNAAVNAYTTQSTTLSGLNSGYTYYVKVRAVKEVYNDYGKKLTYYGKWSAWKSVRVK